jgi:hypothetical protein
MCDPSWYWLCNVLIQRLAKQGAAVNFFAFAALLQACNKTTKVWV